MTVGQNTQKVEKTTKTQIGTSKGGPNPQKVDSDPPKVDLNPKKSIRTPKKSIRTLKSEGGGRFLARQAKIGIGILARICVFRPKHRVLAKKQQIDPPILAY